MKSALLTLGILCIPLSYLHADEESDRKRYLDEIDGLLDGVSGDLDRVPNDSGLSTIEYAVRRADEAKDRARRLYEIRGEDDRAKKVSGTYPDVVDRFKEAASFLRQMKEKQRELDPLPRLKFPRSGGHPIKLGRVHDAATEETKGSPAGIQEEAGRSGASWT